MKLTTALHNIYKLLQSRYWDVKRGDGGVRLDTGCAVLAWLKIAGLDPRPILTRANCHVVKLYMIHWCPSSRRHFQQLLGSPYSSRFYSTAPHSSLEDHVG